MESWRRRYLSIQRVTPENLCRIALSRCVLFDPRYANTPRYIRLALVIDDLYRTKTMNRLHTRKATQVLLLTLLALSQAWAQKVKVGYDKSADFSQFKTYAWQERRTPATRPLVAAAIQLDIDAALSDKG